MTRDVLNVTKSRNDIVEVAKLAGVSTATVSRVANGNPTVDKRLAKKVCQAIEELGYCPNPHARALVSGRSRVLGLLVAEITNPFYPELIEAFENIAGENDFEVMVGSVTANKERTRVFVQRLVQRRVEGVAVMTFRVESDCLHELITADIPLVSVDVGINTARSLVLEVDYVYGFNQAVQHLAVLGHRRIGFVSGPVPHPTNERRQQAFLESAQRIGLASKATPLFLGDHTFEGGMRAADHFLRLKVVPTAIVCANDIMAIGVLRVLAERGIGVPSEMSVVGFDDIHLAEFAYPPLSSIRMSREDLARAAIKGLISLEDREGSIRLSPIQIRTNLVVRRSTAPPEMTVNAVKRRR